MIEQQPIQLTVNRNMYGLPVIKMSGSNLQNGSVEQGNRIPDFSLLWKENMNELYIFCNVPSNVSHRILVSTCYQRKGEMEIPPSISPKVVFFFPNVEEPITAHFK